MGPVDQPQPERGPLRRDTSRIEEAIERLERMIDRHICFPRKDELNEVIGLLREELTLRQTAASQETPSDTDKDGWCNNLSSKIRHF